MSKSEESPLLCKTYDLMLWMMPALTKFPKEQRFRLAARIESALFDFHGNILSASRTLQRQELLKQADLELEKLRIYLRLSLELKCVSFQQYEHAVRLANEVGKLLGGWMKYNKIAAAG